MSGLTEALAAAAGTKGDQVTRLDLTAEERRELDSLLLSGMARDSKVADILRENGHKVTNYAVTYYRRKLEGRELE